MTNDEVKAIKEISGTAGFRVIEYYINKKVQELDSVMDIDGRSETRAGIQALAKAKAVKLLKEILNDLTFINSPEKDIIRKTYE